MDISLVTCVGNLHSSLYTEIVNGKVKSYCRETEIQFIQSSGRYLLQKLSVETLETEFV